MRPTAARCCISSTRSGVFKSLFQALSAGEQATICSALGWALVWHDVGVSQGIAQIIGPGAHIVVPGTAKTLEQMLTPKLDALYAGTSLPSTLLMLLAENPKEA